MSPMTSDVADGPRQRAAETKRRRTREQIVSATIELYEDAEQDDYTREQIAEAAGVGVATLHNHFNSKYGVLRAAYSRILSPVVDPIINTSRTNAYHPPNALQALEEYVVSVTLLSHESLALTTSMIRSYFFDTPRRNSQKRVPNEDQLGWPLAVGMLPILAEPPFTDGSPQSDGSQTRFECSATYHANALLIHIFHDVDDYAETATTSLLGILSNLLEELSVAEIVDRVSPESRPKIR